MVTLVWPNDLWRPLDPDVVGVEGVELLVGRAGLGGGYTPMMSVRRALLPAGAPLKRLADEAALRLARQTGTAQRLRQATTGTAGVAPGLTQLLAGQAEVDGVAYDLRQLDGLLGAVQENGTTAVVVLTAVCTADQLPVVGEEFRAVLESMSVD